MESIGVAVIGGGVVGCAILHELVKAGFDSAFLFEKRPTLAEAQSGRNSGVVHAGIYYPTGSTKARLCVEGNQLLYEFCRDHDVPVANVGKLVAATSADRIPRLEKLYQQAVTNGVPGVRILNRDEARQFEPNLDTVAAMHCPTTGIVDAAALTITLANCASALGAQVLTNCEVINVEAVGAGFELVSRYGGEEASFRADLVINAAGLQAHEVAQMVNDDWQVEVAPLRGEYVKFNRRRREELWMNGANVYPVPQTVNVDGVETQVVGVHLTPTFALNRAGEAVVGNTINVGPEFVTVHSEDYETGRLACEPFLEWAKRFLPGLTHDDLSLDFAGVMVNLRDHDDWIIERDGRHPDCVQLIGLDSPAMTSALAIAR
ncbi:MAG: FAD-dependent oxidoreductase, partial [Proteobacteria bacterium]|nr:FAD-dependent oxidoreductase [Pseudomonadota bacterium]